MPRARSRLIQAFDLRVWGGSTLVNCRVQSSSLWNANIGALTEAFYSRTSVGCSHVQVTATERAPRDGGGRQGTATETATEAMRLNDRLGGRYSAILDGMSNGVGSSAGRTRPVSGMPGWRKALCLGCDLRIVRVRDGWVTIGGTRNGSYLVYWGSEPQLGYATNPETVPDEPLFLLGVAHTDCVAKARSRLEDGSITLPRELPDLQVEVGDSVPRRPYTLHMPVAAGVCPFCDSRARLTREHVWPEWYSRELKARGIVLTGDIVSNNKIDITVPVCAECNNTWMSVLENDAKDLLLKMTDAATGTRRAIALSQLDQRRLAAWALKTAYLIDAYREPIVPRGFLYELALQRVPNQCTAVWVAGYSTDTVLRAAKRAMDFRTTTGQPTNNSPNALVVTFTIMNTLFQVLVGFNGGTLTTMRDNRRQYGGALFKIWPEPATDLVWPPSLGFSRASWDDLVSSITNT